MIFFNSCNFIRIKPMVKQVLPSSLDGKPLDAVSLIDAMPGAHYRGEMAMYARPGHIPTAKNVSVMSLLDENGRYRPQEELTTLFDGGADARAITYCGGGIAASSTAFVMTRLGYTDVAVYTGSLQEWAADPDNPMEVETADQ